MLPSLALIFLLGMSLGKVFDVLKLPKLLGLLLTGIVLGPYVLNILDQSLLDISADLRKIALIIILMRAGLNLNFQELKQVGRPAVLMCFVPAIFEIIGMIFLAPPMLGVSLLEAALLGTVVAAVSPAIIVPRMLHLMEEGYGVQKSIPQMVMAGASVDDVIVIVLFTAFTGLAQSGAVSATQFLSIPSAILLGLAGGVITGLGLARLIQHFHLRDTAKVLVILAIAFLLVTLESALEGLVGFSGLLAVMAMGSTLQFTKPVVAKRLSNKFSKLWLGAEIILFVLVGATVSISHVWSEGATVVLLLVAVLIFRMVGVYVSLIGTKLHAKERLFTCFAYVPKATVQAAIGGVPLALGLASGELILTVAVVSIIVAAPIGALLIDVSYRRLLSQTPPTIVTAKAEDG